MDLNVCVWVYNWTIDVILFVDTLFASYVWTIDVNLFVDALVCLDIYM